MWENRFQGRRGVKESETEIEKASGEVVFDKLGRLRDPGRSSHIKDLIRQESTSEENGGWNRSGGWRVLGRSSVASHGRSGVEEGCGEHMC